MSVVACVGSFPLHNQPRSGGGRGSVVDNKKKNIHNHRPILRCNIFPLVDTAVGHYKNNGLYRFHHDYATAGRSGQTNDVVGGESPKIIVNIYVCGHTYTKSMDQPGKVANPAHGQLNREK